MTNAKSDLWETALLKLIFQNDIADAISAGIGSGLLATVTPGSFFLVLHESAVVDTDATQSLKTPMSYGGYADVTVARSSGGWTVAAQNVSNAALLQFGENTGASATAVSVTVGNDVAGASSEILYYGGASLVVGTGINPQYAIGELDIDET